MAITLATPVTYQVTSVLFNVLSKGATVAMSVFVGAALVRTAVITLNPEDYANFWDSLPDSQARNRKDDFESQLYALLQARGDIPKR